MLVEKNQKQQALACFFVFGEILQEVSPQYHLWQ